MVPGNEPAKGDAFLIVPGFYCLITSLTPMSSMVHIMTFKVLGTQAKRGSTGNALTTVSNEDKRSQKGTEDQRMKTARGLAGLPRAQQSCFVQ